MRVGFIGVGKMGKPIVLNLLRAGHVVTVHNRSRAKVEEMAAHGARAAASSAEAAADADVIGVCVDDDAQVLSVVDRKGGVLDTARPGSVVVIHSTILPETNRKVEALCRERNVDMLEADLSGFPDKAASAELTLMIGGREEVVARCEPYLRPISKYRFHVGPVGAGAAAKLANNVMYIVARLGIYEGLSVARANGIDPNTMVDVALAATGYSEALRRWKADGAVHDTAPGGFDGFGPGTGRILGSALATARAGGYDLPVVAAALDLMDKRRAAAGAAP